MKLFTLSALSAVVASASAADCFGAAQSSALIEWAQAYWDARAAMCSNSACSYQQDCTTHGSKTVSGLSKVKVSVSITRKTTGGHVGFADCYGATNEIINQCVYNEHKMSGVWVSNGQIYEVDSVYS